MSVCPCGWYERELGPSIKEAAGVGPEDSGHQCILCFISQTETELEMSALRPAVAVQRVHTRRIPIAEENAVLLYFIHAVLRTQSLEPFSSKCCVWVKCLVHTFHPGIWLCPQSNSAIWRGNLTKNLKKGQHVSVMLKCPVRTACVNGRDDDIVLVVRV